MQILGVRRCQHSRAQGGRGPRGNRHERLRKILARAWGLFRRPLRRSLSNRPNRTSDKINKTLPVSNGAGAKAADANTRRGKFPIYKRGKRIKMHSVSVLTCKRDFRPLGDSQPFPLGPPAATIGGKTEPPLDTPLQQERQETQPPLDTPSAGHAGKLQLGCF